MTRLETDGGDKDSTDNPGEIHSTQQPEDPAEYTLSLSLLAVSVCCCVTGRFTGSNKTVYPCLTGLYLLLTI